MPKKKSVPDPSIEAGDKIMRELEDLEEKHGILHSQWSMWDYDPETKNYPESVNPEDMDKPHAFQSATVLEYEKADLWGMPANEKAAKFTVPIPGNTWMDLWKAADEVIKLSGDVDHRYIETFVKRRGKKLRLYTGS